MDHSRAGLNCALAVLFEIDLETPIEVGCGWRSTLHRCVVAILLTWLELRSEWIHYPVDHVDCDVRLLREG